MHRQFRDFGYLIEVAARPHERTADQDLVRVDVEITHIGTGERIMGFMRLLTTTEPLPDLERCIQLGRAEALAKIRTGMWPGPN